MNISIEKVASVKVKKLVPPTSNNQGRKGR